MGKAMVSSYHSSAAGSPRSQHLNIGDWQTWLPSREPLFTALEQCNERRSQAGAKLRDASPEDRNKAWAAGALGFLPTELERWVVEQRNTTGEIVIPILWSRQKDVKFKFDRRLRAAGVQHRDVSDAIDVVRQMFLPMRQKVEFTKCLVSFCSSPVCPMFFLSAIAKACFTVICSAPVEDKKPLDDDRFMKQTRGCLDNFTSRGGFSVQSMQEFVDSFVLAGHPFFPSNSEFGRLRTRWESKYVRLGPLTLGDFHSPKIDDCTDHIMLPIPVAFLSWDNMPPPCDPITWVFEWDALGKAYSSTNILLGVARESPRPSSGRKSIVEDVPIADMAFSEADAEQDKRRTIRLALASTGLENDDLELAVSKLVDGGFDTLSLFRTVDEYTLERIGIVKLGHLQAILRAARNLEVTLASLHHSDDEDGRFLLSESLTPHLSANRSDVSHKSESTMMFKNEETLALA